MATVPSIVTITARWTVLKTQPGICGLCNWADVDTDGGQDL